MTDRRHKALVDFLMEYGSAEEAHHKQWAIDQTVRKLCKMFDLEYKGIVQEFKKKHKWSEGISP